MHSDYPLVTVIVPHYNQNDYLQDCLQSVISQTLNCWELIVVDDASTQGDSELLLSQFSDYRCRLIRHERNRGLAAARNTGFRAGRAKLVVSLDADDCLAPSFLEHTVKILQKDAGVDCVFTDLQLFGKRNEIWRYSVKPLIDMIKGQWLPGSGTLMRIDLWKQVGGYCEAEELRIGHEDWDFWLGAVKLGFHAQHVPLPLYLYRQHETNMVSRLIYCDYLPRLYIYHRHRDLFDTFKMGKRFIAEGYQRATIANQNAGNIEQASKLAWAAIRHGLWRDSGMWFIILKIGALPIWLYNPIRAAWRLWMRSMLMQLKAVENYKKVN